jgi:hypothetical protein
MFKLIVAALTIFMACATSKYDRAVKTCNTKCYPQVVLSVEYNYSNNRYDKCVCGTQYDADKETQK